MKIKFIQNKRTTGAANSDPSAFGIETAKKAQRFHASFAEYEVTPLAKLDSLADELGVGAIYVKDESYRFGLNAFKVLGGSYSMGRYIADRLGKDIDDLSYDDITSEDTKRKLGDITFVTATDGNHGRGIAWTANRLGQRCIVYMPKGSVSERLENIKALGAEASITDLNYDDAVRLADETAKKCGGVLVQDTAWDGYERIPRWIMEGYTTMGYEIVDQLKGIKPTHIFLQAGVGAMAGAMTGFFADYCGSEKPIITIVEPDAANCLYRSAQTEDMSMRTVTGDMNTMMAGLACGEPCSIGWEILRDYADFFVSVPEDVAAKGMRVLGAPIGADARVISGESGAAAFGLFAASLQNEDCAELREALRMDKSSRILCISTEGATDRENYKRVVWDGEPPSC